MLQVGDTGKFSQTLSIENLVPFLTGRVHVSLPQSRMKVTRDLYNLNLLAKLMVLPHQILFNLAIAEAILMQIFAVQFPSLHRVAPSYLELVITSGCSRI